MATRPTIGGALSPSILAAIVSIALALAVGAAPVATLLALADKMEAVK